MRSSNPADAGMSYTSLPLCRNVMWSAGLERASRVTDSQTCPSSVATLFKNFLRTGTLKKRCRTSMRVPGEPFHGRTGETSPP